jgi:hypothetical protein
MNPDIVALLPKPRGQRAGMRRLRPDTERLLKDDLSGLHEPIGEAIGIALDRGIEHLDRVRIVLKRVMQILGIGEMLRVLRA